LQAAITAWFWNHQREWGIEVRPEQRVQVSPTRYRVPDVCVLRRDQLREPIASTPPLICIKILSASDTLRSMRERVKDYLDLGTEHVWILDPATREAFVCSRTGLNVPHNGAAAGSRYTGILAGWRGLQRPGLVSRGIYR